MSDVPSGQISTVPSFISTDLYRDISASADLLARGPVKSGMDVESWA